MEEEQREEAVENIHQQHKTPNSLLYETCTKFKISVPIFEQVVEAGSAHDKTFTMAVRIRDMNLTGNCHILFSYSS